MSDMQHREDRSSDPEIARREKLLREELERRLDFLETSGDSVFGEFTTVDWIVCTLLFFVLPLLIMGLMVQ